MVGRGDGGLRRVAMVLALLAGLAMIGLAASGCESSGDDWDDYVGSWTGTGADVYPFTLTILGNGHISYRIDFKDGSWSNWTDEAPDWNGAAFTLTNVDDDGDWSTFAVSFSSSRSGDWANVGNLWSATGGTLAR
jgi:hypothetical protein